MVFINREDLIGQTITYLTINITGSEYMTLFTLFIFLVLVGMLFKLPFNMIIIICTPLLLVFAAYTTLFIPILVMAALLLSLQIALVLYGK